MGKILILEDEDSVNRGISFSLEKAGHTVCSCESIREAKAQVLSFQPEIMICDINLQDGSGLDFIAWFKKLRDAYIICLTALNQEMDQMLGYEAYCKRRECRQRFFRDALRQSKGNEIKSPGNRSVFDEK